MAGAAIDANMEIQRVQAAENLYAVLGVPTNASDLDIRHNYRRVRARAV